MILLEKEGEQILINLAFIDRRGIFGGKNRSLQLLEALTRQGRVVKQIDENFEAGLFQKLVYGLISWIRYGIFKPLSIASFKHAAYFLIAYKKIIDKYPQIKAVVIEGTGFGLPQIIGYLKKKGLIVYFAPANVESLASYDKFWTHKADIITRLQQDVKYFKKADGVFCISSEEQWLLEIMGVKSYYMPYYPPVELLRVIEKRRETRKMNTKENFFLYMADFGNEPNYKGFKEFVAHQNPNLQSKDIHIKLVGKSIERISGLLERASNIQSIGFVSNTTLEEILTSCKGVIIYHYPSSGFLTRIVELWLSGIPVYCNAAAMKSFVHMPGVYLLNQITCAPDRQGEDVYKKYKNLVDIASCDMINHIL